VTVDRDAVAEPEEKEEEEEETARRSVWEERCSGCLGDRTGMVEDNSLHRTDVAPAKRSTALRTKTAGRCMECRCYSCETRAERAWMTQFPLDRTMDTRRFGKPKAITSFATNPNLLVPLSEQSSECHTIPTVMKITVIGYHRAVLSTAIAMTSSIRLFFFPGAFRGGYTYTCAASRDIRFTCSPNLTIV
jgi:hypothetical protein